jgi:predicted dehydrogenase
MTLLRGVMVGCGGRSWDHAEGFAKTDGMELVAVADVSGERARQYQEKLGIRYYLDAEEMLAKERADVVCMCTEDEARYAVTMLALKYGPRALVLEKPMARSVAQAREMVARAKQQGVVLAVSHQMRDATEFEVARQAVAEGRIGEPYFVGACSYGHLMEQGPHMVDMVLWLAGDPKVEWVMGAVAGIQEGSETVHIAPAFVVGYVAFANGMRAELECGRRFPRAIGLEDVTWLQKRTQVLGTEGTVDAVVGHYCRLLTTGRAGWEELASGQQGWDKATIRFYQDLARVLREGGEHRNNADASLRGFEIIQAIYQAAVSRELVKPPLPAAADPLAELMG